MSLSFRMSLDRCTTKVMGILPSPQKALHPTPSPVSQQLRRTRRKKLQIWKAFFHRYFFQVRSLAEKKKKARNRRYNQPQTRQGTNRKKTKPLFSKNKKSHRDQSNRFRKKPANASQFPWQYSTIVKTSWETPYSLFFVRTGLFHVSPCAHDVKHHTAAHITRYWCETS